tara:strand:+ start:3613 stop:5334 length:1722 start_codon:yes stop_codon:yes gene_type:complete
VQITLSFFRQYPRASLITVFAFLFSSIAEGIGLLSFVPLLYLALNNSQSAASAEGSKLLEDVELVAQMTSLFGPLLTIENVIIVLFIGLSVNNYLILLANQQIGVMLAKLSFDFRIKILSSIYRSRWDYFASQPTGHFSSRLTNEVKRAATTYMDSALLLAFVAQSITYLVLAGLVSLPLTALALAVALLAFLFSNRFIRASGQYGKANTNYIKQISKRAVESISGIKAIKAMGKEPLLEKAFFSEINQLRESQTGQITAAERLKMWQKEIILFFMLLGLLASFYTEWVSPVEVMLLAAVLMRFFTQTTKVATQIQKVAVGESAFRSLEDFLQQAESHFEVVHGGLPPRLEREIEFRDVGFHYGEKPVFRGLNARIRAREITTLIGASGSGKTTFIDLIAALLEPDSGSIWVDGKPLAELDISAWRQMIGYVPQEAFLLHDSIMANITLGDPGIGADDVEQALAEASALEFVHALPGGVDFNVGERGSRLSGGQRQRIMIARALVHKPVLLIFDEATSSLDPASEAEICRTISSLRGAHTVLCSSHRPMLVEAADQVIDLENGPSPGGSGTGC